MAKRWPPVVAAFEDLGGGDLAGGVAGLEGVGDVAVPELDLDQLAAGEGGGVEDQEGVGAAGPRAEGGEAAPPGALAGAAAEAEVAIGAVLEACATRGGLEARPTRSQGGGVDLPGNRPEAAGGDHAGVREGLLEEALGVLVGLADAGAGEDVVELQEHGPLPGLQQRLARVVHPDQGAAEQGRDLGVEQGVLALAVGELDLALGCVATLEDEVQLPLVYRQIGDGGLTLDGGEVIVGGGELDLRPQRPALHLPRGAQVDTGGAAAVVADAVDPEHLLETGQAGEGEQAVHHARGDLAVVAGGRVVVGQHPRAVGALPPEKARGLPGDGGLQPWAVGAVVVVAADAAAGQDAGHGPGVAEGVALPVDLDRVVGQAEVLVHPAPGVEQVAAEDLAAGHVLVALDPLTGGDIPAALGDAALDHREDLGGILAHRLVDRGLALGEVEVGELVHEPVHGGEGVVGDRDGLGPGPHPVHVNVGVAGAVDRVLLRHRAHRGEQRLGLGHEGRGAPAGGEAIGNESGGLVEQGLPLGGAVRMGLGEGGGKLEFLSEASKGGVVGTHEANSFGK